MEKLIVAIDPSITSSGVCCYYNGKRHLFTYSEHWSKKHIQQTDDINNIGLFIACNKYKEKARDNTWRYMHTVKVIFDFIEIVSAQVRARPIIVIENYSYGSAKGSMAFSVGEFVGAIKYTAALRRWPLHVLAPTEVKKSWTGKGNANKELMLESAKTNVPELIKLYDEIKKEYPKINYEKSPIADLTDAYAICETFLKTFEKDK